MAMPMRVSMCTGLSCSLSVEDTHWMAIFSKYKSAGCVLCCAVPVLMFYRPFVRVYSCPAGTATFTNLGLKAPQGVSVTISASCNWLTGGTVTGSWVTTAATLVLTQPAGVPPHRSHLQCERVLFLRALTQAPVWRAHFILQLFATVFTFIGFSTAVGVVTGNHFRSQHGILGLFVFLMFMIQFALGVVGARVSSVGASLTRCDSPFLRV